MLDDITGGLRVREYLNVELPTLLDRRADLVALLEDDTLEHIEFQADNDPDMPYREGIYGLVIGRKFQRRVRQAVIYFGDEPMRMADHIDLGGIQVAFRLIDIREIDADRLLASGRPGDLALALLAKGGTDRLREILVHAARLPGPERERVLLQMALLSGLRRLSNRVKMELNTMSGIYIDVESNPLLKEWIEAGVEKGLARAVAAVRAELTASATAAATAAAARATEAAAATAAASANTKFLRRLLERKFGPLPQWVTERLESGAAPEWDLWADRILTADSLEEVLGKH